MSFIFVLFWDFQNCLYISNFLIFYPKIFPKNFNRNGLGLLYKVFFDSCACLFVVEYSELEELEAIVATKIWCFLNCIFQNIWKMKRTKVLGLRDLLLRRRKESRRAVLDR